MKTPKTLKWVRYKLVLHGKGEYIDILWYGNRIIGKVKHIHPGKLTYDYDPCLCSPQCDEAVCFPEKCRTLCNTHH